MIGDLIASKLDRGDADFVDGLLVVAAVSILLGTYPSLVMDLFHGVIGAP